MLTRLQCSNEKKAVGIFNLCRLEKIKPRTTIVSKRCGHVCSGEECVTIAKHIFEGYI